MSTVTSGIAPFDPAARHGLGHKAVRTLLRVGPVRESGMSFARHADPFLVGLAKSRLGAHLAMPIAVMTTTGAKTGLPRTAAILYFTSGADVILIGSNFGGDKNPAWFYNLKANADAVLVRGGVTAAYKAELVHDKAGRERLFGLADRVYPGFAVYRRRTAAVGRTIPIFRLRLNPVHLGSVGIPEFDPSAQRGLLFRLMRKFGGTKIARPLGINVAARVDPVLVKWSGGRVGMGLVMPTAGLTTTGAKSGVQRSAPVLYFTDAGDVILIASNFGRDHHPGWYHNLVAHPACAMERGGVKATYTAALVEDEPERDRLLSLAEAIYGGYTDYRARTAAIGRRIPVFRLTLG